MSDTTELPFLLSRGAMLFFGNVVVSAIGLGALALITRALGSEGLGMLVLITAYATIIDRLMNFQSHQTVIKFGIDAHAIKSDDKFGHIIRFGMFLDASTAIFGTMLALLFAPAFVNYMGWDVEMKSLVQLFCVTIIFNIKGTPTAVLQIMDNYGLIMLLDTINAAIRLAACALVIMAGGGLVEMVIAYTASAILGSVLFAFTALATIHRTGFRLIAYFPLRHMSEVFPGVWSYVWMTNLNSSIRMTSREVDVFVVEWALGSAAVGLYRIAKSVSKIIEKLIEPLYKAVYPILVRHVSKREYHKLARLSGQSSALLVAVTTAVWIFIIFGGKFFLALTFGREFVGSYHVLIWYMGALIVAAAAFPLQPIMLSFGRPQLAFWAHLISTTIYFCALIAFLQWFGLVGAGAAYLVYYFFWSLVMLGIVVRLYRSKIGTIANT